MFLIETNVGAEREAIWLDDEDSALACVRDLLRANADVYVCQITTKPANDSDESTALGA